jgi:LCP family protein required for cell wall assembly
LGVAGLLLACIGVVVLQQRVASAVKLADVRADRPGPKLLTQPSTILLLGVDLRPGQAQEEGVRSDTLLLLRFDPLGGWGSLVSIPRDTVAPIPGFDDTKINAAFSYGYTNAESLYGEGTDPTAAGAALAADTVEQFLGLSDQNMRIDGVATINFDGFADLIDALGGIDVDVPRPIVDNEYPTDDFGITTIRFDAGPQHMNGEQALQYVRTRHADSDFGRGQRQQQVVQAMAAALRKQPVLLRPITALRLAGAAGGAIRTTLPVGRPDALLMALFAARIDPGSLATYPINPETARVDQIGSDLVWNRDDVLAITERAFQPPEPAAAASPSPEQATVQVQNGAGVAGVAAQASEQIRAVGFTVADAANAELVERSTIIDYGTHAQTRARLATLLGSMPVEERPATDAPQGVDVVVLLGSDYATYLDQ